MKKTEQSNMGAKNKKANETVEVLYQKMGDRWFAFSMIDNEVFVGSISQEQIDALEAKNASENKNLYKVCGNT